MRKKSILVVAVMLVAIILATCFVGCDTLGVIEFKSFRQKIVTVLKDNGIDIAYSDRINNTSSSVVGTVAEYVKANKVSDMKDIIVDDNTAQSDVKRVSEVRQEMYEQALFIPLIVGDAMVNNHGADTIYNTSVLVDTSSKTYMEFKTSGTLTTINAYTLATESDSAYSCVVYLDYISKKDYNFVMLGVWEDGKLGYRYGNAQKQFCYVDYDPQGSMYEIYCSASRSDGYISSNADTAKRCIELVKSQFDGMKASDYSYLTNQKYTIDETEVEAICEKYFPSQEQ